MTRFDLLPREEAVQMIADGIRERTHFTLVPTDGAMRAVLASRLSDIAGVVAYLDSGDDTICRVDAVVAEVLLLLVPASAVSAVFTVPKRVALSRMRSVLGPKLVSDAQDIVWCTGRATVEEIPLLFVDAADTAERPPPRVTTTADGGRRKSRPGPGERRRSRRRARDAGRPASPPEGGCG
jgi:hypothetical protein